MNQSMQPPVSMARRLLLGAPLATEHSDHALLRKLVALPVFASDAISSVAYASQQILLALGGAGLWAASQGGSYGYYTMLITGLICLLLGIVVVSYWQTVFAYPSGGGSYIVSKENLGAFPGLVAAAALLIDYVLTVSVSIAAGIQNLKDVPLFAHAGIETHLVLYCLLAIGVLTYANLRGLKESGTLFAPPTYAFVGLCYLMILLGVIGPFIGWHFHTEYVNQEWGARKAGETLGLVVLMKAFANGCSAMTGTEAVSNGIPAFRGDKSKNAALTLLAMGAILGSLFLGISFLAVKFHVVYWEDHGRTASAVIDQLSGAIFGKSGKFAFLYVATQVATALILVLAANTAYADFPRLASILSKDRYLPRQLSNVGDRLVFNNGILLLGIFAALLIVAKHGSVDALIPLYAIGVFLAFTLSQTGMVIHWRNEKGPHWQVRAVINGVGALATFLVLLDIAFEKFTEGAWIVILLMAALVGVFRTIHAHYIDVANELRLTERHPVESADIHTVVLLVPAVHRGVLPALTYARAMSCSLRAVHIAINPEKVAEVKKEWHDIAPDVPLVVLPSPYRMLVPPLMDYLTQVQNERDDDTVTVILPEAVPTKWWHHLLHNQTGFRLKLALLARPDLVVTNVRYSLKK